MRANDIAAVGGLVAVPIMLATARRNWRGQGSSAIDALDFGWFISTPSLRRGLMRGTTASVAAVVGYVGSLWANWLGAPAVTVKGLLAFSALAFAGSLFAFFFGYPKSIIPPYIRWQRGYFNELDDWTEADDLAVDADLTPPEKSVLKEIEALVERKAQQELGGSEIALIRDAAGDGLQLLDVNGRQRVVEALLRHTNPLVRGVGALSLDDPVRRGRILERLRAVPGETGSAVASWSVE